MAARRVTAHDIAQAGSVDALIGITIDQIRLGRMEDKEYGASVLRSLTEQQLPAPNLPPQSEKKAPGADGGLGLEQETLFEPFADVITMIAKAKGIKPLVVLLGDGSSLAQRDAAGSLANIARRLPLGRLVLPAWTRDALRCTFARRARRPVVARRACCAA